MTDITNAILQEKLNNINWDFEDYSSSKYPLDINSIPWYPASFPAPIPKYLTALLSETGSIVMDPFGGKGTTAFEALKQGRRFLYNDINPHAVNIVKWVLESIETREDQINDMLATERKELQGDKTEKTIESYVGKDKDIVSSKVGDKTLKYIKRSGIKEDVIFWFHSETLKELVYIHKRIEEKEMTRGSENIGESKNEKIKSIKKLAFVSILKEVCSQRGHFSYVTDNCRPLEMKYYDAIAAYLEMLERIRLSCADYKRQFSILNKNNQIEELTAESIISSGDAKKFPDVENSSVDLIITSPPYLCAQDYILTMRLNDFFYPDKGFVELPFKEIGPRRLRTHSGIVDSYFNDMELMLKEMYRVLKKDSYFCMVIGQGKGKVSEGIDVIQKVIQNAEQIGFDKIYQTTRNISYRTNRIGGVDKEDLIIFQKPSEGSEKNKAIEMSDMCEDDKL